MSTFNAASVEAEPGCCGEPMVHNSFTSEYECMSAYSLLTEHVPDLESGSLALADDDDVPAQYLPFLQHWRASRIPDRMNVTFEPLTEETT